MRDRLAQTLSQENKRGKKVETFHISFTSLIHLHNQDHRCGLRLSFFSSFDDNIIKHPANCKACRHPEVDSSPTFPPNVDTITSWTLPVYVLEISSWIFSRYKKNTNNRIFKGEHRCADYTLDSLKTLITAKPFTVTTFKTPTILFIIKQACDIQLKNMSVCNAPVSESPN